MNIDLNIYCKVNLSKYMDFAVEIRFKDEIFTIDTPLEEGTETNLLYEGLSVKEMLSYIKSNADRSGELVLIESDKKTKFMITEKLDSLTPLCDFIYISDQRYFKIEDDYKYGHTVVHCYFKPKRRHLKVVNITEVESILKSKRYSVVRQDIENLDIPLLLETGIISFM